ncbi:hypothetical protein HUT06_33405 [Actinomadura sp. NAK00032]|uniref:hypothetical protein n=1 Tax=Actinomadura sp. NAK00032 TaxID=2742128 RepID=UPI0015922BBB|nr:hypothetical protein [Actinomadura sp. NAK00032]QKW38301.1 hypothetical protein HUT06_33405 [Actinomadura sp. NAK00032]
MHEGERITCIAFRIGGWDRLDTPARLRARAEAAGFLGRAGQAGRAGRVGAVLGSGEVLALVLRADPAEAAPVLLDGLRRRRPPGDGTTIGVAGGPAGPRTGAEIVAEAARLLRRPGPREAPFTVVIGALLHWRLRDARSMPAFQRVKGEACGPDHWVWPAGHTPSAPHGGACPGPERLLALAQRQRGLGERRAAVETCRYLLRRYPLTPAAYPLMDLEEHDDVASAYLADGLRVVRSRTGPDRERLERLEYELLLALANRAYRRGRSDEGDRLVNAAAEVFPAGDAPLRVLAREAARRGDRQGARVLLAAALARTWEAP